MKGLGFLEETILLLVIIMDGDAYGYSISEAYQEHTGKSITLSAIHAVLSRLEKKGLVNSFMGGATSERGGRRKRIFKATAEGVAIINDIRDGRQKLWDLMPDL
ncbi:MAG: helix-turn-helix transcriptional regulator [Bacteroidota bacterium]